jgi:hypothetical protein
MALRIVDLRFLKPVRDPCSDDRDAARMDRLTYQKGREWTYVEEGGWLKLTGKVRTVWVGKSNVADALLGDVPEEKGKAK